MDVYLHFNVKIRALIIILRTRRPTVTLYSREIGRFNVFTMGSVRRYTIIIILYVDAFLFGIFP